jgi:hypothetical protein
MHYSGKIRSFFQTLKQNKQERLEKQLKQEQEEELQEVDYSPTISNFDATVKKAKTYRNYEDVVREHVVDFSSEKMSQIHVTLFDFKYFKPDVSDEMLRLLNIYFKDSFSINAKTFLLETSMEEDKVALGNLCDMAMRVLSDMDAAFLVREAEARELQELQKVDRIEKLESSFRHAEKQFENA